MIKNRHFCLLLLLLFVCLFLLFIIIKKQYLRSIFLFHFFFFLQFRVVPRHFYGRFALFFLVPNTFANVTRLRLFQYSRPCT